VGEGAGPEGTDSALREIDMTNSVTLREAVLPMPQGAVTVSMGAQRMVFSGSSVETQVGSVRSFGIPLGEPPIIQSYAATSARVVRLMLSYDDTHLFAAGADGSIVVFEVRASHRGWS